MRENKLKGSNWRDFEKFVAELWETKGWDTKVTDGRKDGGADVFGVRRRRPKKIVIQCKRQNNPVGVGALGQVERARNRNGGPKKVKGVVVTTAKSFTKKAKKEARDTPKLQLITRTNLMGIIRKNNAEGLALRHLTSTYGTIYSAVESSNSGTLDDIAQSCYPVGLSKEETREMLNDLCKRGLVKQTSRGYTVDAVYI